MKAKEYLLQAQKWKRRYEHAVEELEYVRNMASGVKAIRYDKDLIQSSPDNDQMADYMVRLEKAEARALEMSEKYFAAYTTTAMQIEQITPQLYSDILYGRYIQGMRLWQIADRLHYSYEWIRILHGRALAEFGKTYLQQTTIYNTKEYSAIVEKCTEEVTS